MTLVTIFHAISELLQALFINKIQNKAEETKIKYYISCCIMQ